MELVLAQLEELFFSSSFAPGDHLNEFYLARQMGVSRASFREAARKLEQRGWLVSLPNRGFFVRRFGEKEVSDLYEARFCLEAFALHKALPGLSAASRAALEEGFAALQAAAEGPQEPAVIDALLGFHRALASLADNAIVLSTFDGLAMDTKLLVSLMGGVKANPKVFVRRNALLLRALLEEQPAAAEAELKRYLGQGLEEMRGFVRAAPG